MIEEEEESYYPNIDVDAFCTMVDGTDKCDKMTIGATVFYIIKGTGNSRRRTFNVRTNGLGTVDFNFATKYAHKLKFLGQLIDWFREHRKWHDGAYIE